MIVHTCDRFKLFVGFVKKYTRSNALHQRRLEDAALEEPFPLLLHVVPAYSIYMNQL